MDINKWGYINPKLPKQQQNSRLALSCNVRIDSSCEMIRDVARGWLNDFPKMIRVVCFLALLSLLGPLPGAGRVPNRSEGPPRHITAADGCPQEPELTEPEKVTEDKETKPEVLDKDDEHDAPPEVECDLWHEDRVLREKG